MIHEPWHKISAAFTSAPKNNPMEEQTENKQKETIMKG